MSRSRFLIGNLPAPEGTRIGPIRFPLPIPGPIFLPPIGGFPGIDITPIPGPGFQPGPQIPPPLIGPGTAVGSPCMDRISRACVGQPPIMDANGNMCCPPKHRLVANRCCPGGFTCKRVRRMNPLNPRALRRSMRRVKGFEGFVKRSGLAPRKSRSVSRPCPKCQHS